MSTEEITLKWWEGGEGREGWSAYWYSFYSNWQIEKLISILQTEGIIWGQTHSGSPTCSLEMQWWRLKSHLPTGWGRNPFKDISQFWSESQPHSQTMLAIEKRDVKGGWTLYGITRNHFFAFTVLQISIIFYSPKLNRNREQWYLEIIQNCGPKDIRALIMFMKLVTLPSTFYRACCIFITIKH